MHAHHKTAWPRQRRSSDKLTVQLQMPSCIMLVACWPDKIPSVTDHDAVDLKLLQQQGLVRCRVAHQHGNLLPPHCVCRPNGEVACFRASAIGLRSPARQAASPSSVPAPLNIAHNQPLSSLPTGLGSVGATVGLNHAFLLVAMQDAWKTWVRPLALLSTL